LSFRSNPLFRLWEEIIYQVLYRPCLYRAVLYRTHKSYGLSVASHPVKAYGVDGYKMRGYLIKQGNIRPYSTDNW